MRRLREFARSAAGTAVFGVADGVMSVIGIIVFIASRSPGLVFGAAAIGAVGAAYSMGSGEFLGQEKTRWSSVPVMAGATFFGTVAPAVPYLWARGWTALAESVAICLLVALAVGHLRTWRRHRYMETVAVIGVGVALTIGCNLLVPGGAG